MYVHDGRCGFNFFLIGGEGGGVAVGVVSGLFDEGLTRRVFDGVSVGNVGLGRCSMPCYVVFTGT